MSLERGKASEVYNVCSGTAVVLADIIEVFQRISGIEIPIEVDPQSPGKRSRRDLRRPSKLEIETGWQSQISLVKTLEAC
jgi:nucleoside-diphosphate-sugar epimerase